MTSALVLPIGQYGGANDPTDNPDTVYPIRVGERVRELDRTLFTAWLGAHGLTPETGAPPWTVSAAAQSLAANGVADGERHLNSLRGDGLIAVVEPKDAVEFARRHALAPLILGLGEDEDSDAGLYPLGFVDHPVMYVAGPLYAIWTWAAIETDLWSACQRLARDARDAGIDHPDLSEPEAVLSGLVSGLHGLLAAGAAYLDRVYLDAAGSR